MASETSVEVKVGDTVFRVTRHDPSERWPRGMVALTSQAHGDDGHRGIVQIPAEAVPSVGLHLCAVGMGCVAEMLDKPQSKG